jgi:hypothetical protein
MLLSDFLKQCGNSQRAAKLAGTDADINVHEYLSKQMRAADVEHQRVSLGYNKGDVHSDKFIPNFSIAFRGHEKLIADLVSPIVQVGNASDKYVVWDRATAMKTTDDEVGPLGMPGRVEQAFSTDTYTCVGRALEALVANDILANADAPLDLLSEAAADVRWTMAKNRELRVATLVTTAANYATNLKITKSGTAQWSDITSSSTSDPIQDIVSLQVKDDLAAPFNAIVMSDETWMHFRKHPKVTAALGGSGLALTVGAQGPHATEESVKAYFKFDHVLIGDAKRNTANPAATAAYSRIWGNSVQLLRIHPGASMNQLCSFKTFRHQPLSFITLQDPRPGVSGATIVKGSYSDGDKMVAQSVCGMIIDAIA